MHNPAHSSSHSGSADAGEQPRSLLRRLRDDPLDAIIRIAGEIGPRRPTSLGEAQAAAYLDGRLRRAGLRVSADAFRTTGDHGWEGLLLALLALVGIVLYYWLPLPSVALALWNLATAVVALLHARAPLIARKRPSQNVIATRAIDEAPQWRVVLLAALDAPLVSRRLTRMLTVGTRAQLGRVVACALIVLFALLGLSGSLALQRLLWYSQFPACAYLALLAALDLWAIFAPTSAGAANHAGALAALLESAETLNTLSKTELWVVALGATSNGAGLADLLRRYPFDRRMTFFIGIESLGAGRISYVTREGRAPQYPADALLLRLVAEADAADPLIDAEPRPYSSEPALVRALQRDRRRALTLIGLDADGWPAQRGSVADTPDHIDPQALDRAVRLVVGLVKKIDAASPEA